MDTVELNKDMSEDQAMYNCYVRSIPKSIAEKYSIRATPEIFLRRITKKPPFVYKPDTQELEEHKFVLPILRWPDARLNVKAESVKDFDQSVRQTVSCMFHTLAHRGLGLAATQVGIAKRIIVLDFSDIEDEHVTLSDSITDPKQTVFENKLCLINPVITSYSKDSKPFKEGCLSVPNIFYDIERPSNVKVKYQDIYGAEHELWAGGLTAVAVQHEIDHLDGIVFVEKLSKFKQRRTREKLRSIK